MENKTSKSTTKTLIKGKSIRISSDLQKKSDRLLLSANKKKAGAKIKFEQLVNLALDLVQDEHIKMLQDKSLTGEDRKEILRQRYIAEIGPISKDAFTNFTLTAEFQTFLVAQKAAQIVAPTISSHIAS